MSSSLEVEDGVEAGFTGLNALLALSKNLEKKALIDSCYQALNCRNQGSEYVYKEPPDEMLSKRMLECGVEPMDVNFNIRFSRPWHPDDKLKKNTYLFGLGALSPYDYENVTDEAILSAPISDICLVQRNEVPPDGYYRISRTPKNKRADLNTGSGGNHFFLCIKKCFDNTIAPITSIVVVYPDKKEYIPPGFSVVKRGGKPCNINSGSNAERIFLCYKRDIEGNPLTDLLVFFPSKGESAPVDYYVVDRSIRSFIADLNMGTGAQPISVCYKISTKSLDCLLPKFDENVSQPSNTRRLRRPSTFTTLSPIMDEILKDGDTNSAVATALADRPSPSALNSSNLSQLSNTSKRQKDFSPRRLSNVSDINLDEDWEYEKRGAEGQKTLGSHTEEGEEVVKRLNMEGNDMEIESDEGAYPLQSKNSTGDDEIVDFTDDFSEGDHSGVQDGTSFLNYRSLNLVTVHDGPVPYVNRLLLHSILSGICGSGEVFDCCYDLLSKLLMSTDFFNDEFKQRPVSGALTVLDVTISVLVNRLDFCVEILNNKIIVLLINIIKKCNGMLSKLSTQKLFLGGTFVCSAYSSRGNWVTAGYPIPVQDDGKDMPAYILLKELIITVCNICEKSDVEYNLPETVVNMRPVSVVISKGRSSSISSKEENEVDSTIHFNVDHLLSISESYEIVCDIVTSFFDEVIDTIETSKISELTLQTVSKKTSTTLSPMFWVHINSISKVLYESYDIQNAFILLCAFCKIAWMPVKSDSNSIESVPRHLGNKLIGIECLREFCRSAGPKLRLSKIMGYQIRRVVVSCICMNMTYAMQEPRIFAKLLKLMTTLWLNWREHIRVEFPLVCEQLIIKILQAPPIKVPPLYQFIALKEINKWFEQPHMLVEMFVNFDMDGVIVSAWNIFSHIIRAVCRLAEKASRAQTKDNDTNSGPFPSDGSLDSGSVLLMYGNDAVKITLRDVQVKALSVAAQITRVIMDSTGHANLIIQDLNIRKKNNKSDGGMHESNELVSNSGSTNNSPVPTRSSGATNNLPSMSSVIKTRREHNIKDTNLLQEAIKIYQEKDSLSKAIKYLISKEFMANTPQEVASFLRIYKNNFDPAAIGDYLGEGGRTPEEEKYWDHVRYQYTRAVSFVDMDIEPSLRLYLTGCGFRMPGEAQKIDRFMSAFVKIFWQDNHGTEYSPFKHSDTVHLLGYAIIMLNTDLHRANMDKKKNAKKMTKEQFIKNLRGADQGDDIPSSYLSKIYDNIAATPIEMAVDIPKDTNSLPVTNGNDSNTETNPELMGLFVQDMLRNLRSSEDLLRSLSSRMHRFYIMGIDISISLELVCFMFESVWNNFYAISDTLLTTLNNDENVIFSALDLLSNTLSSCIFLDLKVEKIAFATLLAKFRKMCEACESASTTNSKIALTGASFATGAFRNNEKWFSSVENSTAETAIMAIADIFRMIVHLKDVIRVFSRREVTKTVFARIEKKANIADANRFFLTEGDLKKRNRNGKLTSYRFFLFSDILIYCHYGFSEYKVHEQMELDTMEIRSIVEHDPANIQFAIIHPTKSFTVMADSVQEKMSWVRTLNEAIDACVQRKSCQKLDILDRMQHQENKVNERSAIIENYGRSQNSMKYIASTPVKDKSNKQLDADKTNEDGTAKQVSFDDSSNLEQQKVSEGSSPSSDAVSDDPEYESLLPCATSRNREYSLTSDTVTSNSVMADKHTNDPMLANDIKVDKDVYHDRNSEYEEEDRNDNNMMDDDLSSEGPSSGFSQSTDDLITSFTHSTLNTTSVYDKEGDKDSELSKYLSTLDDNHVTRLFNLGLKYWKHLLDAKSPLNDNVSESTKLMLYGLFKQAKYGKPTDELYAHIEKIHSDNGNSDNDNYKDLSQAQLNAWQSHSHLSSNEAKKYFIITLHNVFPQWEYKQFVMVYNKHSFV